MQKLMIQTETGYREATTAEVAEVHGRNMVALTNQVRPVLDSPAASRKVVVSALEGGYNLSALGRSVAAHIKTLAALD